MKKASQGFWGLYCFGMMFASCASMADCSPTVTNCSQGQYNKYGCHGQGAMTGYTGYECEPCPAKFPYSAGGSVFIDSCYVTTNVCGQSTCRLYGDGHSDCSDSHPEYINNVLTCLPKTRACSDFELSSVYNIDARFGNLGQWYQSDQMGNAVWNGTGWVADGCSLTRTVSNITTSHPATCDEGVIWRRGPNVVWDASRGYYNINYSNGVDWYYCTQCGAGKAPVILSFGEAFDDWACNRLEGTNPYMACSCENVSSGFYSTGCTIDYPLNNSVVPIGCTCGLNTGFVLSANGNSCVPDSTEYCDSVGCFMLGSDLCE